MIQIGNKSNPLPTNTTILFDGSDTHYDTYQVEVTLLEVVRGDEALSIVQSTNDSFTNPEKGKEYLLAKFLLRALYSENDSIIDMSNASFSVFHTDGSAYEDSSTISGTQPSLKDMYAGSEQEGFVYFLIDSNDKAPNIVFLERNKGGIWFSTDKKSKLPQGSKVYVPSKNQSIPKVNELAKGTRLNPFQLGVTVPYDGRETLFDTYQADIKLIDVVRGDEALNLVAKANSYNRLPPSNQEYLLARFSIKTYHSKSNEPIELSNDSFDLVSGDGLKYNSKVTIDNLEPSIGVMKEGSEQEGYVYFLVNKNDSNPLIVFLERNKNGIWFTANTN
ncbi:MAG TPA: hypothetical protein VHP81_12605 [Lachnospiraceae bacterium]|nr:hypothetical protein [Lachnospiraceae bacterium]